MTAPRTPLRSMSFVGDHGLVLAEQATEDRSNEIPTVRALLKMLDLSNTIITADAMHCQRETAEQVLEQDEDYVIAVKANQPAWLAKIQGYFEGAGDEKPFGADMHCEVTKGHGRHESRTVTISDDIEWI